MFGMLYNTFLFITFKNSFNFNSLNCFKPVTMGIDLDTIMILYRIDVAYT